MFLVQEEEHRMRKVALNISKDVKKFWIKIEKLASSFLSSNVVATCDTTLGYFLLEENWAIYIFLFAGKQVVYKHQLEVEERKKKALDKQLDFLLGQTERYVSLIMVHLTCSIFNFVPSCIMTVYSLVQFSPGIRQCWRKTL